MPSALAVPAASAATAAASAGLSIPPPPGVSISVATSPRSDCEGASLALASPVTGFTVGYSKYRAQAGGGSDPGDSLRKCQMLLDVHVPQGYTFAVDRVDYRGFAVVAAGATGRLRGRAFFQGTIQRPPVTHEVRGPSSDDWSFKDETPPDRLVFKPCGEHRALLLETELEVDPGTSDPSVTSLMAQDSGTGRTYYSLFWKTCP
ncbi:DUF4360 domain-containing protein [Spirillospora sp. NBC_00431]